MSMLGDVAETNENRAKAAQDHATIACLGQRSPSGPTEIEPSNMPAVDAARAAPKAGAGFIQSAASVGIANERFCRS